MSKIGRKPIDISDVQVEIKGSEIHYKGAKSSGVYVLPEILTADIKDNKLFVQVREIPKSAQMKKREINRIWGLHRSLLNNKIQGAKKEFEKNVEITGLGYKAALSGDKLIFSLGFSHKKDFPMPKEVSVIIDKTGQKLTFKSFNKKSLGDVCSKVCVLRPPEPYKGTGIKLASKEILRKAGKTK